MNTRKLFRWWHAVLIFVAANLVSAIPVGFGGDFAFYNSFRQPPLAPPDWAFAPVWFILNITSLIAIYRVANFHQKNRERRIFFISEALGWSTTQILFWAPQECDQLESWDYVANLQSRLHIFRA